MQGLTKEARPIRSKIWSETPEDDNPFAAATCRCSGYDVYGDLLGNAGWCEYLFLLFAGERPSRAQARLLETLAVALANPGPRDASVRAAMTGAVTGTAAAGCLMGALGAGAGGLGGGREIVMAMESWARCQWDLDAWRESLAVRGEREGISRWPHMEHPAGFDPHGASCATPVRQALEMLSARSPGEALPWLSAHRGALEEAAGCPLAMSGVAAAALVDLRFSPAQGEMLYLLLRLPGAAAHALEQAEYGWEQHPFFSAAIKLLDDPGSPGAGVTGGVEP